MTDHLTSKEQAYEQALKLFTEYFSMHYSGNVHFHDPAWHARRIFRQAQCCLDSQRTSEPPLTAETFYAAMNAAKRDAEPPPAIPFSVRWAMNQLLQDLPQSRDWLNPDVEKIFRQHQWQPSTKSARPCTCHPDDNPPKPCPQKYALSECRAASETSATPSKPEPVFQRKCWRCGKVGECSTPEGHGVYFCSRECAD